MFNIPIFLRNCFKLECPGTRIGNPVATVKSENSDLEKTVNAPPVDHLLESIEKPVLEPPLPSPDLLLDCIVPPPDIYPSVSCAPTDELSLFEMSVSIEIVK